MNTVLLVIHLFVTLALIGVILIQRSEGGGLGIGTSQGMGGLMSGRGTANLLTRTTAVLSTLFMLLSLGLALLNRGTAGVGRSLLDTPPTTQPAPSGLPVAPAPLTSPTPSAPGSTPGTTPNATPAPAAGSTPAAPAPAAPPEAPQSAPRAPQVPTN